MIASVLDVKSMRGLGWGLSNYMIVLSGLAFYF